MDHSIRQFLNVRAASGGVLSPDGRHMAFLSNLTGLPQAWVVDARSGWPQRLTFSDHAVRGVRWSPDGQHLVYSMDADGNERHQLYVVAPDGSGERRLTDAPEAIHAYGDWSPDGWTIAYASNSRDPRYFDIWLLNVATGEATCVLASDATLYAGDFSPDGTRLLVRRMHGSLNGDLAILDLTSGETTLLTPHEGVARFDAAVWRPDGQALICVTDLDADFCYLAEVQTDGSGLQPLLTAAWDIDDVAIAKDGALAYTINAGGRSELHLVSDGQDHAVADLPLGVISGLGFCGDGGRMSFTIDGPQNPSDVWLFDRTESRPWRVTCSDRAGLPAESLLEPELIRYPSFDGLEIPGWFYRPTGQGPHPAILYIHGGPESQTRAIFNPLIAFFVQRGYAVLAMNVRGSTGYGKAYHRMDDKRLRLNSVDDAAAAVPWLVEQGCDPERMICFGGSYGGFMVLSLITRHPDLWAAAVDIVGISNFVTFLQNTGAYRRKLRESEYGSLEEDGDFLAEISPINHVDQVRCPLFVVQGAQDPRVPKTESDQMVEQLQARGIEVEYQVYDDEGHGLVKLPNRIAAYTAIAEFLDRNSARPAR